MKVADLIKNLQTLPQDADIAVYVVNKGWSNYDLDTVMHFEAKDDTSMPTGYYIRAIYEGEESSVEEHETDKFKITKP